MANIVEYYDRYYPAMGGIQTYISTLTHNMPEHDFQVVTDGIPGYPKKETSGNTVIIRIPPSDPGKLGLKWRFLNKVFFPYMVISDILRFHNKKNYLLKSKYDIIHFHGGGVMGTSLAYLTINILKRPYFNKLNRFDYIKKPKILTVHGIGQQLSGNMVIKRYEDEFIGQFGNIICVDKNIYEFLRNKYKQEDKRIYFIPNPVDTRLFKHSEVRHGDRLVIGFVGRLGPERGIGLLISLIERLPCYAEIRIIGAGTTVDIDRFMSKIGERKVNIALNVSNDKIPDFLNSIDVLFNPVVPEGISRITLEAMSCGKPVIMINKGNRYPVVNGKTGYLINNDINGLLSLIDHINNNREELDRFGRTSREVIEREFSVDVIIPKIRAIYDELLAKNPGEP